VTTPRIPGESPERPRRATCCDCCDVPDKGPCPQFVLGGNGRCACCDHDQKCHNKPVKGRYFNTPLGTGERKEQDS
jgi:hypothetical protein